jgi:hypothetical protein
MDILSCNPVRFLDPGFVGIILFKRFLQKYPFGIDLFVCSLGRRYAIIAKNFVILARFLKTFIHGLSFEAG